MISVVLCIDYSDYLSEALQSNASKFEKIYIITEKSDIKTIELAKKYTNCEILFSEKKLQNGAKFNKSAIMREAQEYIHAKYPDRWICLMDADVVLPDLQIDLENLNKKSIYGIGRHIYATKEDYIDKTIKKTQPWSVMGYFQLYYDKTKLYGPNSESCAHCDVTFTFLFEKRVMLPYMCSHLGDEAVNWNGRKSVW